jgi:sugar-specific transcriptional regulator TrmB
MTKKRSIFFIAFATLFLGLALAQLPSPPLTNQDVVICLDAAQSEILVAVTRMQNHNVAQALHDAAYKRGVAVYILVPTSDTESPTSEINSLVPAGANVRVKDVDETLLVIDRQEILKGDGIAGQEGTVVSIQDTDEVARVTKIFIELFKNATPYAPIYLERHEP